MTTTLDKPIVITEFERLGLSYELVAQYDLDQLSVDRRVQTREGKHYAPREEVERYVAQMEHSEFPPIIVTRDGWTVDGNTRVGAARRRKNKFFPAYVLDVDFASSSPKLQHELYMLGTTLNGKNGRPPTRAEARKAVQHAVALGWLVDQMVRATGLKPSAIATVKREVEAEAKIRRVGLAPVDEEGGTVNHGLLRSLGNKAPLSLNDEPFRALTVLADEAGLNHQEILSTAKEMRETGSDAEALEVLTKMRTEMAERIRTKALTGTGKPPVPRQLRQHMGMVVKYRGKEDSLVERNPDNMTAHLERMKESVAILQKALELQLKLIGS